MALDLNDYPLLARATIPQQLRQLPQEQLPALSDELRSYLLHSVSQSSGHFASGLGTVELLVRQPQQGLDTVPAPLHQAHADGDTATFTIFVRDVQRGHALLDAALKGIGIIQLPDYYVSDHLARGDLIELLPEPKPHSNTVATLLKILVEKDFVQITNPNRNNLYSAKISKP